MSIVTDTTTISVDELCRLGIDSSEVLMKCAANNTRITMSDLACQCKTDAHTMRFAMKAFLSDSETRRVLQDLFYFITSEDPELVKLDLPDEDLVGALVGWPTLPPQLERLKEAVMHAERGRREANGYYEWRYRVTLRAVERYEMFAKK